MLQNSLSSTVEHPLPDPISERAQVDKEIRSLQDKIRNATQLMQAARVRAVEWQNRLGEAELANSKILLD